MTDVLYSIEVNQDKCKGSLACVKLLLEAGADVGARAGQLGETPLHGAAGRGHAHVVLFCCINVYLLY